MLVKVKDFAWIACFSSPANVWHSIDQSAKWKDSNASAAGEQAAAEQRGEPTPVAVAGQHGEPIAVGAPARMNDNGSVVYANGHANGHLNGHANGTIGQAALNGNG